MKLISVNLHDNIFSSEVKTNIQGRENFRTPTFVSMNEVKF